MTVRNNEITRKLNGRIQQLTIEKSARLESLGLSNGMIDLPIMFFDGVSYKKLETIRTFLAVVLTIEPSTEIHGININNNSGFSLKRSGSPTENYLFRRDGSELYVAGFGQFAEASPVRGTDGMAVGLALVTRYTQGTENIREQIARQEPNVAMPRPEDAIITPAMLGAIGDRIRECWTGDTAALDFNNAAARLQITLDASGTIREARVIQSGSTPAARAFAECAVRAALAPQCAT